MYSHEELADRAEIHDLVTRYALGVERRDVELLVALFTEDAVLDYYGQEPIEGAERIREMFSGRLTHQPDPAHASGPLDAREVSTPVITNVVVELDGDRAHAESYALAIHAGPREDRRLVLVRGTRNRDDLVRTPKGWRIARRVHELLWSFETPGAYPPPTPAPIDAREPGATRAG